MVSGTPLPLASYARRDCHCRDFRTLSHRSMFHFSTRFSSIQVGVSRFRSMDLLNSECESGSRRRRLKRISIVSVSIAMVLPVVLASAIALLLLTLQSVGINLRVPPMGAGFLMIVVVFPGAFLVVRQFRWWAVAALLLYLPLAAYLAVVGFGFWLPPGSFP